VTKRILTALQQNDNFVSSHGLESKHNWQGKVQTDNRLLSPGDIFVCIKGDKFDGHRFIDDAIKSGAALIVCSEIPKQDIPYIMVRDTRKAAALIARITMLPEVLPYTLIGVTGTNGKTTTTLMLYEALRKLGHSCGWIGTSGYYIDGEHYLTMHTTPDIIQLNAIFAQMVEAGLQFIVMEVSSHALSLDRVYGVKFDYCLFSNLSRDHLDFHGDMSSYAEAKFKLFERNMTDNSIAVINTDDHFGEQICKRLHTMGAICHSVGSQNAEFCIDNIQTDLNRTVFSLTTQKETIEISSLLIGSFNVQNLALTVTTLINMEFSPQSVQKAIQDIPPVVGRIEKIDNTHGFGVFIDYAHTPDAIENLLKSMQGLPHRRILCLIGAGGDRDKGKRPLMLKAALKYSDAVIVTDDNPRSENPDAIIRDIVRDSDPRLPWWIIRERSLAIKATIRMAQPGDIVLICGKGHESYQEIEGVRNHFSDHEETRQALDAWLAGINKSDDELILPVDKTLLNVLFTTNWAPNEQGYLPPQCFSYLSTDTRSMKTNSLFIAIKGERFDGHEYLSKVLCDQQNYAIADQQVPDLPLNSAIKVENSVAAMGIICHKYLQMFDVKRIALTGSTGKTTTKELIARILEDSAPTLKTIANENNLIGVCKTILRILPQHHYAVFELGTNHFGEIAAMAGVLSPDYGIILNIGPSHLEYFGDEEGVYKEKSDLFRRPLALRLYPSDDDRFIGYAESGKGVGYSENSSYCISDHKFTIARQSFLLNDLRWNLPYGAPHYAVNAAFAIALALELGLAPRQIQHSLDKPIELSLRGQIEPRGKGMMLIDCYNANPWSMQKALEFWQQISPNKPHVAILGDMLELGDSSQMFHQMISAMLGEMKPHQLITVGEYSAFYHNPESSNPKHFKNVEQLQDSGLIGSIAKNAIILIKASHGIHLERLIPAIKGE